MQVLAPRTAPLWVSAVRLLPAGAVLVGWAAAQGRPQPSGRMAWAAIAAFALADGACFQVRLLYHSLETTVLQPEQWAVEHLNFSPKER